MNLVIELDAQGARVRGEAVERSAPIPAKPANAGHGDVRKKIVPVIKPPAGPSATDWEGGVYLSMQEWLDGSHEGGGILLQPADNVAELDGRIGNAGLISVEFHRVGDGRGYSHAFLLRKRLNYLGRLRALGAVTADQVFAMAGVGFDSFALRADQSAETAIAALESFTVPYQGAPAAGDAADRAEANFAARVRLLERALTEIAQRHERPAFASSLSAEDMVVTDAIARLGLPIDVFTLDTGRLHEETVALIGEVRSRYGLEVPTFRPDQKMLDRYIAAFGPDGFYDGVEERKMCCNIRKVEPLNRALQGRDAWITGQRREQAATRRNLAETEADGERAKYNPLADWAWADVLTYAGRFDIPMSALYARGYVSIGCEPCTKAIRPGEDPRNGRWWWEGQDTKECGLHTNTTTTR